MKLDRAALMAAVKKMLAKKAEAPKGKMSQTRRKKMIRAWKTRPRAACDSFRYRQKHQAELRAKQRVAQRQQKKVAA